MNPSQQAVVFKAWCAIDQPTLEENLQNVGIVFSINGVQIDSTSVGLTDFQPTVDGQIQYCRGYAILINSWSAGTYEIVVDQIVSTSLNNGWNEVTGSSSEAYIVLVTE